MLMELAIGLVDQKSLFAALTVWRQTEIEERLIRGLIPGSDLHDSLCVLSCRNLTSQFLRQADHLFYLLYSPHALTLFPPDVVFDADSNVQPERDRDVAQRQNCTHPRLHETVRIHDSMNMTEP
jgi:hypothetical protein